MTTLMQRPEMRSKPIRLVGRDHPALHQAAADVTDFDMNLEILAWRMLLSCRAQRGLAIAAPQVGIPIRMVVVNDGTTGVVVVNPVVETGGKLLAGEEACLSIPGRWFDVPRHQHAVVVGQDVTGRIFGCDAIDTQARMWQHEDDHMHGRLLMGRFDEIKGQSR
jgi:peptide deformylase